MIEAQVEYVAQALTSLAARPGADWLDVRPDASDAFVQRIDAQHARGVWTSGCDSWYLGEDGRNFTLWPGTVRAYERELATFDAGSYRLRRVGVDAGDLEPVAV